MIDFSYLVILPPLLAIIIALLTKEVFSSIIIAILASHLVLLDFNIQALIPSIVEHTYGMLQKVWILKTLGFALLVGSLMQIMNASGGVDGFSRWILQSSKVVRSSRGVMGLAFVVGIVVFIETSIAALVVGTVIRPLARRFSMTKAKVAYLCDTTSAPICSIVPFNAWGALFIGLISAQVSAGLINEEPIKVVAMSVMYNFYAFVALAVLLFLTISGKDYFTMANSSELYEEEVTENVKSSSAINFLLPLLLLIFLVFLFLYITGDGNFMKGSGSSSILYAVVTTVLFSTIMYKIKNIVSFKESLEQIVKGAYSMFSITAILFLAFILSDLSTKLEIGLLLSNLASNVLEPSLIAAVIFVLSAFLAFATGTSWGTFSIMMPIAVQMAVGSDANLYMAVGAVMAGGVFGDHCSVISDTSIVSSMAAKCDHVEHVKTQLPYALFGGFISLILYILFGEFI